MRPRYRIFSILAFVIAAGLMWSVAATAQTEFKVIAPDAAEGDQFGISVSTDGGYAIEGAYANDDAGSGSAYLFARSDTIWTQQAKLTAADAAEGDLFGYSVSTEGNNTIVGALNNDDIGENTGSAYIHTKLFAEPSIATSSFLNFGDELLVDGIATVTDFIKIKNSGTADLTVNPQNNMVGGFVVSPAPLTVAPGDSVNLAVGFIATTAGRKKASLVLNHNDTNVGGQTTIELHAHVLGVESLVVAWGDNGYGQATVPQDLTKVIAIAAGAFHNLALKSDSTVVAWGNNGYGQATVPQDLAKVITIAAGRTHSLALKSDGTAVGWGYNGYGQATVPQGLAGVTGLAGGFGHSVALKSDGTVVAWGRNDNGQANVPEGLEDVIAITAGYFYSLALKSDGTVIGWGRDTDFGFFGSAATQTGPTVIAIAGGSSHFLALVSDGTMRALGYNGSGQTDVPPGLSGVSAVSAGEIHSVALKSDGTVVAWGLNNDGQTNVPEGLVDATAIAGGGSHSLAMIAMKPVISGFPSSLSFGDVLLGNSAVDSIKVENTGNGDLKISQATITGADSASFPTSGTPLTVEPGGSTYVRITFTSTSVGAKSASFVLTHNAEGSPTSIPITGFAVAPVTVFLGTDFGAPGDTLSIPVTLANPNTGRPIEGVLFDVVAEQTGWRIFTGTEDVPAGFSANTNYVGDSLRVVMSSNNAAGLEPADETGLMTLRYVLTQGSPLGSTNDLFLADVEAVDTLAVPFPADTAFSGRLQTGIGGDNSLDGRVSISDVVLNVQLIFKNAVPDSGNTAHKIADANADGSVDVADVIRQVNTILKIVPSTRPLAVVFGPVTVSLGDIRIGSDGRQLVPVVLGGGSMISGVQMTFTYDPSLMTVGELVKTEYDGGLIWQHHASDGVYRLVGYSMQPSRGITAASEPSFYLPVSITNQDAESSVLTLTEVKLVDRSAYSLDVLLESISATVKREVALPATFSLSGAAPNPFNPSTTISYEVPEQTHITLTVYNLLGQEVVRLVDQVQAAGRYEAIWNGTNIAGAGVASGIYLYRITSGSGYTDTKRMTLLK